MNWVEQTIADFGRIVGIEQLAVNEHNVVCLEIENMGRLYIEPGKEYIYVNLLRQLPLHQTIDLKKMLSLCHFSHNHPCPINPVLDSRNNRLLFVASVAAQDFSLPGLEKIVNLLDRLCTQTAG